MKYNKEILKQILLTFIAIFLIIVGYLNYNLDTGEKNKDIEVSAETNDINIGDVQLVNAKPQEDIVSNDELGFQDTEKSVSNDETNSADNIEDTTIEKYSNIDNYFEETKLERDRMYSEMIETYQKLVNSEQTPTDQKAIAAQEITNITNQKNGIMISENLIKNKGFDNVVILVNNETVSVIVKSPSLNKEQISKIQNIIQRELKTEISKINISNKN